MRKKKGARREVILCRAQGITLRKKKAELQTVLKLIATLWKQGKISGVCRGNLFIAVMSCPENNCKYRKSHHSIFWLKFIDVVRQTKNKLDNLEDSSMDFFFEILLEKDFSLKVASDLRDSAA